MGLTEERDLAVKKCMRQVALASHDFEKAIFVQSPHEVWLEVLNTTDPFKAASVLRVMRLLSKFMNWIGGLVPCGTTFGMVRSKLAEHHINTKIRPTDHLTPADHLGAQIQALRIMMTSIIEERDPRYQKDLLRSFAPYQQLFCTSFGPNGQIHVDQSARDDVNLLILAVTHGFFNQGMKGDEVTVKRCALPECGRFFVPYKRGHGQAYCSKTHQKRDYMRGYRKGLEDGSEKGKEKTETEATNDRQK